MNQLPQPLGSCPASLLDVAETLGLPIVLRLMAAFGGREVKFPRCPGPGHEIVRALGERDARALCALLGGDTLYVPHARRRRSSRDEVLELEARGLTRGEIAARLRLSQRHVRRVANAAPAPAALPLFPDA
jgi:Mor family transcriptional regulator